MLGRKFNGDLKPAQRYLTQVTIPHLQAAQEGIDTPLNEVVEMAIVQAKPQIIPSDEAYAVAVDHRSAGSYAKLVFAHMKHYNPFAQSGFMERAILAILRPPETPEEMRTRLAQQEKAIRKLAQGVNTRITFRNWALLRTVAFYATAKSIGLETPKTRSELDHLEQERFEDLIGNTIVDFTHPGSRAAEEKRRKFDAETRKIEQELVMRRLLNSWEIPGIDGL